MHRKSFFISCLGPETYLFYGSWSWSLIEGSVIKSAKFQTSKNGDLLVVGRGWGLYRRDLIEDMVSLFRLILEPACRRGGEGMEGGWCIGGGGDGGLTK